MAEPRANNGSNDIIFSQTSVATYSLYSGCAMYACQTDNLLQAYTPIRAGTLIAGLTDKQEFHNLLIMLLYM